MKILGIDYGERKIGLAIAESSFAEPLRVIRYSSDDIFGKIKKIVTDRAIDMIIVGVSENKSAQRTVDFINKLSSYVEIPIERQDETLSTKYAQELSKQTGMKRKKRKAMEDAYAATIILQEYIDENNIQF